ncbi:MAG TPA: winged helix-turn-helix domain-containing protein [Bryobacteraceae bacterium]|nr:winged helix-turn-helix domain-containing protein [Bryobacteraceae bacterium]
MHCIDRNTQERLYRDAHVEVDFIAGSLQLDSRPVRLTRKESALLTALVCNAGDIMNREVLLSRVWGYGPMIRTRTLDVHIRRLRKKLGAYGDRYIETIFGVGYRFQPYREPRTSSLAATAGLAVA